MVKNIVKFFDLKGIMGIHGEETYVVRAFDIDIPLAHCNPLLLAIFSKEHMMVDYIIR